MASRIEYAEYHAPEITHPKHSRVRLANVVTLIAVILTVLLVALLVARSA